MFNSKECIIHTIIWSVKNGKRVGIFPPNYFYNIIDKKKIYGALYKYIQSNKIKL